MLTRFFFFCSGDGRRFYDRSDLSSNYRKAYSEADTHDNFQIFEQDQIIREFYPKLRSISSRIQKLHYRKTGIVCTPLVTLHEIYFFVADPVYSVYNEILKNKKYQVKEHVLDHI